MEEKGEEKGEGKDQLEVDVDGLQIHSNRDRRSSSTSVSRLHSRSHSPAADPCKGGEGKDCEDLSVMSGRKSECDGYDSGEANDMPWDHSLVIAEPDVQVRKLISNFILIFTTTFIRSIIPLLRSSISTITIKLQSDMSGTLIVENSCKRLFLLQTVTSLTFIIKEYYISIRSQSKLN